MYTIIFGFQWLAGILGLIIVTGLFCLWVSN